MVVAPLDVPIGCRTISIDRAADNRSKRKGRWREPPSVIATIARTVVSVTAMSVPIGVISSKDKGAMVPVSHLSDVGWLVRQAHISRPGDS